MNAFSCYGIQSNLTVGDIKGNLALLRDAYMVGQKAGAELVIASELCITGYPPEDLLLSQDFLNKTKDAVSQLAEITAIQGAPALLVGAPYLDTNGACYNAAILLDNGKIHSVVYKHDLPNFGVFDEKRYFCAGPLPHVLSWRGKKLGVMICEDMWHKEVPHHLGAQGADCFIVLNASPFEREKHEIRTALAQEHCQKHAIPLIYINQTGGQDELVFDGTSFVMNAEGDITQLFPSFEAHHAPLNFTSASTIIPPDDLTRCYHACVMGLRDYVRKNGFKDVLIGLSGGIDSALTAVIAVDALGKDHVHLVMMPSPYTAEISLKDAKTLAENLGARYDTVPIKDGMHAMDTMLAALHDPEIPCPIAKENIQSRLRGNLLMAISNSTGALLITTGNKSEMSVGYATLYGDMCGAYNPLKDLYKMDVFALSRWRNRNGNIIPERIITRPPSAELREHQKDEDSLPPYDVLDAILYALIDKREHSEAIITKGFDAATVQKIAKLVTVSEYKRKQAPIGTKLTSLAYGRDRRFPITHQFKL